MNESLRTMVFVGVAAMAVVVAWVVQPAPLTPPSTSGTELFAPFDANDASALKIVQFDEDTGKTKTFEVAKEGGRWRIPSHDNYPADAADQLKKVASLFVEMKAIGQPVADSAEQHEIYGVRDPQENSGDSKGFGREVTISSKDGEKLVDLIVGKEATNDSASNAGGEKPEYHFVRRAGQDPVYVAEISMGALTTNFDDWIERDLLNLNAFDVAKLDLRDYSLVPVANPNNPLDRRLALLRRMDTVVSWNATGNNWSLDKMTLYNENEPLVGELAEDEELNKAKLDGVKTAVDDLKIIDAERKPKALADALKDETLRRDQGATAQLQKYGFFVMRGDSSQLQILGSNGGLRVSMKDGVEYVLNFGNAKSAEKGDASKLNRYLMVTAQVDESMIPKPELEPESPAAAGPAAPGAEGDDSANNPDSTEIPAEGPQDEAATDSEQEEGLNDESASDDPDGSSTADPATDTAAETKNGSGDSSVADPEKSAAKPQDPEKKSQADAAAAKNAERIKKENQRKLDDYHAKQRAATARVAELNARFGDWFYVVSDDVYKKVQLGRADIVKDRESAKDEGFGVDAFRKLETEGVKPAPKGAPMPPLPPGGLPGFGAP